MHYSSPRDQTGVISNGNPSKTASALFVNIHLENRGGYKLFGSQSSTGFSDGTPTIARFDRQISVIWSPGGEVVFIADPGNNRIRYIPRDLTFVSTLAGTGVPGNDPGSEEDATLDSPQGLVLMGNSLFFSQRNGHNIRKIDLPVCPENKGYDWGQSECAPCLAGQYSNSVGTFCNYCPIGTFSSEYGTAECIECPAGSFTDDIGTVLCKECPAGMSSEVGAAECHECPIGTFSSENGTAECIECPAGTFANDTRSIECTESPAGMTSEVGAAECHECLAGMYSDIPGLSNCKPCAPGSISTENRIGCLACIGNTVARMEVCVPCEDGFTTEDHSDCLPVPPEIPPEDDTTEADYQTIIMIIAISLAVILVAIIIAASALAIVPIAVNYCLKQKWSQKTQKRNTPALPLEMEDLSKSELQTV